MFSKDFDTCFERVIGHEGGFQKKREDRGNWTSGKVGVGILKGTKYGISALAYPAMDIENMTLQQAKEIYWRDWWQPLRMDNMPKVMRFQMFDGAINHGMFASTQMLQRAVGAKDDGKIGPITIGIIAAQDHNDTVMAYLAERLDYMANASTWAIFGKGWARRIANNLRIATKEN